MKNRVAVLIAAALSLALILAPAAGAQVKRTVSLDDVVVKTGLVDGTTFAGLIRGGPLGRGTVLTTARPAGEGRFASVGRVYYLNGTMAVTFTNTSAAQPDGSTTFNGSGRVVGGTGRYRGARGTFTFTGTAPAMSSVITLDFSGSVRY